MLGAISIVLVLGGLIFFHEFGHFIVARMLGIGVHTFSLGFGPTLWKRKWGKTTYQLAAIPLGGYVSLVGMDETAAEKALEASSTSSDVKDATSAAPEFSEFSEAEYFSKRSPFQRILVVAAGAIFNLFLAFFIYWGLSFVHGKAEVIPVIGAFSEESPAQMAGMALGDRITAINGVLIQNWDAIPVFLDASEGKELQITVSRGAETLEFAITPNSYERKNIFGELSQGWIVGIVGTVERVPLSFFAAAGEGWNVTWGIISLTGELILKMIERVVPMDNVGGPIMIAQVISEGASRGFSDVLSLAALISINLGIFNLLPVPVLDGGHIVFYTIEMVQGKPVRRYTRELATKIGLFLLLTLMIFATYNDIWRAFFAG